MLAIVIGPHHRCLPFTVYSENSYRGDQRTDDVSKTKRSRICTCESMRDVVRCAEVVYAAQQIQFRRCRCAIVSSLRRILIKYI